MYWNVPLDDDGNEILLEAGDGRKVPPCQAHMLLYDECCEPGKHYYTDADPTDPYLIIRLCDLHWNQLVLNLDQIKADIADME
jgi:hypothetical protein